MGQLTALFYKNWILYKRSLLGNVLEFAIPIFFILFVILVRKLDTPSTYSEQSFTNPVNTAYYYDIKGDSIITHLKYIIFYLGNALQDQLLLSHQQEIHWPLIYKLS